MVSLPLDFESSASASFTTSAYRLIIITHTQKQINTFLQKTFVNFLTKKLNLVLTFKNYTPIIVIVAKTYAPLAQLVEQLTLNQWAPGSSPRWRTNKKASKDLFPRSFFILWDSQIKTLQLKFQKKID